MGCFFPPPDDCYCSIIESVNMRKYLLQFQGVKYVMEPMRVRGYTMPPVLGPSPVLALGENADSTRDPGYTTRSTVIPVEVICEKFGEGR